MKDIIRMHCLEAMMSEKILHLILCCGSLISFAGGYNPEEGKRETIELYKKIWNENQQKFTIQSENELRKVLDMKFQCSYEALRWVKTLTQDYYDSCAPFIQFLREARDTGLLAENHREKIDQKVEEYAAVKNRITHFDVRNSKNV
jgi:hypothetical protein